MCFTFTTHPRKKVPSLSRPMNCNQVRPVWDNVFISFFFGFQFLCGQKVGHTGEKKPVTPFDAHMDDSCCLQILTWILILLRVPPQPFPLGESEEDSLKRFQHVTEMTILTVQLIVEFSKRVPGFDTLLREDQITLLKVSPVSSFPNWHICVPFLLLLLLCIWTASWCGWSWHETDLLFLSSFLPPASSSTTCRRRPVLLKSWCYDVPESMISKRIPSCMQTTSHTRGKTIDQRPSVKQRTLCLTSVAWCVSSESTMPSTPSWRPSLSSVVRCLLSVSPVKDMMSNILLFPWSPYRQQNDRTWSNRRTSSGSKNFTWKPWEPTLRITDPRTNAILQNCYPSWRNSVLWETWIPKSASASRSRTSGCLLSWPRSGTSRNREDEGRLRRRNRRRRHWRYRRRRHHHHSLLGLSSLAIPLIISIFRMNHHTCLLSSSIVVVVVIVVKRERRRNKTGKTHTRRTQKKTEFEAVIFAKWGETERESAGAA